MRRSNTSKMAGTRVIWILLGLLCLEVPFMVSMTVEGPSSHPKVSNLVATYRESSNCSGPGVEHDLIAFCRLCWDDDQLLENGNGSVIWVQKSHNCYQLKGPCGSWASFKVIPNNDTKSPIDLPSLCTIPTHPTSRDPPPPAPPGYSLFEDLDLQKPPNSTTKSHVNPDPSKKSKTLTLDGQTGPNGYVFVHSGREREKLTSAGHQMSDAEVIPVAFKLGSSVMTNVKYRSQMIRQVGRLLNGQPQLTRPVSTEEVTRTLSQTRGSSPLDIANRATHKILNRQGGALYNNLNPRLQEIQNLPRPQPHLMTPAGPGDPIYTPGGSTWAQDPTIGYKLNAQGEVTEMETSLRAGHMRSAGNGGVRAFDDINHAMRQHFTGKDGIRQGLGNNLRPTQIGHRVAWQHSGPGHLKRNLFLQDAEFNNKMSKMENNLRGAVERFPERDFRVRYSYQYDPQYAGGRVPRTVRMDTFVSNAEIGSAGFGETQTCASGYSNVQSLSLRGTNDIFATPMNQQIFGPDAIGRTMAEGMEGAAAAEAVTLETVLAELGPLLLAMG